MLPDGFTVLDAVCYDNVAIHDAPAIEAAAYIFTSPLNVKAYADHHAFPDGADVIAIGPSTGKALTEYGVPHVTAAAPTEQSLVDCLHDLRVAHSRT